MDTAAVAEIAKQVSGKIGYGEIAAISFLLIGIAAYAIEKFHPYFKKDACQICGEIRRRLEVLERLMEEFTKKGINS